jgi:uncharacterized membrane protein YdjX (TVP38/TMEM64 family)
MHLESDNTDQPIDSIAPAIVPDTAMGGAPKSQSRFAKWLVAGSVLIVGLALLWFGPQIWQFAQDEDALEAWVASLGWLGPIALIALNAIQIVVAPIPGYVVQVAAGFLFGPFWGGVWSSFGLLLGSSVAFGLARSYGRPLVGRLVGHDRLEQWEHISHSTSTLVWLVLLLSPIGDLPYFLAGLARVSFVKIFVITLVVRVPSTFVVVAAGAGILLLTWWQVALLLVALLALLILFLRYQEQIVRWSERHVGTFLGSKS